MVGLAAERLAGERCGIGDGDGLRASEGADELAVQDVAEQLVAFGIGRIKGHLLLLAMHEVVALPHYDCRVDA